MSLNGRVGNLYFAHDKVCVFYDWRIQINMQEHIATTADGWNIHLHRYPPRDDGPGQPLLFVHGMGANRYNFDLNERLSLARAVSAAGFDAWVVELRGRGLSPVPAGKKAEWNFEDFLHQDLRAAVDLVRKITGQPMHWVGHSMGGMLGVAFSEVFGEQDLRSLILFATPLMFGKKQFMIKAWGIVAQVHRLLPTMDQEKWGRMMLPLMSRSSKALDFFMRYLANPDNIDDSTVPEIFKKLVANESSSIILQFSDWVRSGEFRSADKSFSYSEALQRVRVPCFFVCGSNDRMAPPQYTSKLIDELGSETVRMMVLSMENGFSIDYGHGDLIIGKYAPMEVYPLVIDWLNTLEAG